MIVGPKVDSREFESIQGATWYRKRSSAGCVFVEPRTNRLSLTHLEGVVASWVVTSDKVQDGVSSFSSAVCVTAAAESKSVMPGNLATGELK